MELVKGMPITEFCDQNQLTPRERLELFVPVCQAVQHAHQKGIIHRDLKPSNVLVSRHDTTPMVKVIDFGVAKALGQQLTDKTLFTGIAQMIGTPLYMSPEQAGTSDLDVDTRSDIYSLGVLLYELLTGTTPFDRERLKGVGYDEMRRIIREEEPPRPSTRISTLGQAASTVSTHRKSDPRQLSQVVRGELDWIVMKALEKDRNRRYESASAFAADVERYLSDEPVLACPPSARYQLQKFARRHRRALVTAALLGLMAVVAIATVADRLRRESQDRTERQAEWTRRLRETEGAVSPALAMAEFLGEQAARMPAERSKEAEALLAVCRQAEAAVAEAEAALKTGVAEEPLRERVAAVRQRLDQVRGEAGNSLRQALRIEKLQRGLDEARMARLALAGKYFNFAAAAKLYSEAFRDYGLEVQPGKQAALARRIRAEKVDIRDALIVALDDWAFVALEDNAPQLAAELAALAKAADDDVWRVAYRSAADAKDVNALMDLSARARRLHLPPSSLYLLAFSLSFRDRRDEAIALLRWARDRYPTDFWMPFQLGLLLRPGERDSAAILEERTGCYRVAVALRPDAAIAHNNLGVALIDKNQLDQAIDCFLVALSLKADYALAQNNLAAVFIAKKEPDRALDYIQKALRAEPDLAGAWSNRGVALEQKDRLDDALAAFEEAVRLNKNDARTRSNFGNTLRKKGRVQAALDQLREAIKLQPRLAVARNYLGLALAENKERDKAVTAFQEAVHLDPTYAEAWSNLGAALAEAKQWARAATAFETAIQLDPGLADAHSNYGVLLVETKRPGEAIAHFQKAIELDPKVPDAHFRLGRTYELQSQWDKALGCFKEVIRLAPRDATAQFKAGTIHAQRKHLDEAIAFFREAIRLKPDFAPAHNNLGVILGMKGRLEEAIACAREALRLDPSFGDAKKTLARVLDERGWELVIALKVSAEDAARALEMAKESVQLNPKSGNTMNTLGVAYYRTRDWKQAIATLHEAANLREEGGGCYEWFFIAMSNWQLGDKQEARKWFDRGVAWIKRTKHDSVEVRRIRAEAATLLRMIEARE
jgi:tetratricopeptide (TPR) repeat protein